MRLILTLAIFGLTVSYCHAQMDTIVFLSGRQIPVKSVEVNTGYLSYRLDDKKARLRKVDNYRLFGIRYANGTEQVIYREDSYDSLDFSVDQMRLFIRGEQDADRYFKGRANMAASFVFGAAASYFTIYGLLIPPLYSTVVGAFSPNVQKSPVSDPALRDVPEYVEGYQRKVRDKKIRNSLLAGLAGFASGFIVLTLAK